MAGSVSIVNFIDRFTPHIKQKFWTIYAPVVLIVTFWWFRALYGFNPSDDGLILSQSWRIIHGEIPHVDFTSPRPLGSAYLHAPFALLPFAMLALSRLFVVFQFFWIAKMTVSLVRANGKEQKPWLQFAAICCVFFLNIGTWPIMAWHTVDGIFLSMTALAFTKRNIERSHQNLTAWIVPVLCAGYAPLVKQGFALVPVLVLFIVYFFGQKSSLKWTPLMGLPGVVFVIITSKTPGGLLPQLHPGSRTELFSPLARVFELVNENHYWNSFNALMVLIFVIWLVSIRLKLLSQIIALFMVFATFFVAKNQDFSMFSSWSFYFALVLLGVAGVYKRNVFEFVVTLAVLSIGYCASLSWGVNNPGLLGGTFVFLAFLQVASSIQIDASRLRKIASHARIPIILGFTVLIALFTAISRDRNTYVGPSKNLLNTSVEYSQFKFIKMSATSAAYIDSVGRCLAKYPADKVAVLPDGPGLYPFFGLQNPFDSDWWFGAERVPDKSARDLETVDELNGSSSWLVLVQSYFVFDLATMKVEGVSKISNPFFHNVRDIQILNALQGEDVLCDSFTGKYRPRGS
jgi:hypothetical protein